VSMRTFSDGEVQELSSPKERALSPIVDGCAGTEEGDLSGEVTANVESLSRLVLEDELDDARNTHADAEMKPPLESLPEQPVLKVGQDTPVRTPTTEQETSPLPESWDLYKQFKGSQAALNSQGMTASQGLANSAPGATPSVPSVAAAPVPRMSPEVKSTAPISTRKFSPEQLLQKGGRGAAAAASLRATTAAPAPPLPSFSSKVSINSSPNNAFNRGRSPDTVDMSGVVKSIQMGPISRGPDEQESEVPEGRKSFATFQSTEPCPELFALKQASRRLQEPKNLNWAMRRHQHHRSDLNSSAERFREMRDQVMKATEDDQQMMAQKAEEASRDLQMEDAALQELEKKVEAARQSVEGSRSALKEAKHRLLQTKARRVALQQAHYARTCLVTRATEAQIDIRLRGGATATISMASERHQAHLSLRLGGAMAEALEGAWQDACASMPKELDKVDDCGTCKDVVLSTSQLPTLLRHLDVAALKAQVEARSE
ncbi:unnamed protein product, partial [Symbiodinium necroappetens]